MTQRENKDDNPEHSVAALELRNFATEMGKKVNQDRKTLSLHFDQSDPYTKVAIKAFHDQHLVQQRVGCHLFVSNIVKL
ncbi:MAG: hypothetical protein EZS28_040709, partial [Streblomastix strix]